MKVPSIGSYGINRSIKINNQKNNVNYLQKENLNTVSKPVAFKGIHESKLGSMAGREIARTLVAITIVPGGIAAAAVGTVTVIAAGIVGGIFGRRPPNNTAAGGCDPSYQDDYDY